MKSLADLIPFQGDPLIVLTWDNFSFPAQNVLRRTLWRMFDNKASYTEGVSHSFLREVTMQDMLDTKMVGKGRADETLKELASVFSKLEDQLAARHITLDIDIHEDNAEIEAEDRLGTAVTLEELQEGILEHFNDYREISDRTRIILEGRHPALIKEPKTLEALGDELGVTRERVRQIAAKYMDLQLGCVKESNDFLLSCVEIIETLESESDFSEYIFSENLTSRPNVGTTQIHEICLVLGLEDLAERITQVQDQWESVEGEFNELANQVQKYRTKMGLLDLGFMSEQTHSSMSDCTDAISNKYPRSIFAGNLALARTAGNDTMFESTVAKQLLVCDFVSSSDLIEGLVRAASGRNTVVLGDETELCGIIYQLAGNPPTLHNLNQNLLETVELVGIESWLLDLFSKSKQDVLHRSEIVRAALEDDVNASSVQIYLLKSPIIRSHGDAIYSLVGTQVSSTQISIHAATSREAIPEAEFHYSFSGTNVLITIKPNINTIQGVLFPPAELKSMVKDFEFSSTCDCQLLVSNQVIKVTPSNFWTGFTAIFKHGMTSHGKNLGEEFEFLLDFDNKLVQLKL